MSDDFSDAVKRTLANRVGHVCSNPECRAPTSGPQDDPSKAVNLGVAAHITAASPGGPRHDSSLSPEERSGHKNGIWLCQNCAKHIDNDPALFTVDALKKWKSDADAEAKRRVGKTATPTSVSRKIHTRRAPTSVEDHWPDVLLQCHWQSPPGPPMPPGFHLVRNRSWELSAPGTGPLYNVQIQAIDFGEFRASFEPVDCLTNEVVLRSPQISDLETNTAICTHDLETLITHGPTGCDAARFSTHDPLAVEIPVCVTYSDARGQKYAIDYVFKYDLYHEEGRIVRKGGITKQ
jgi:hypothetical protein